MLKPSNVFFSKAQTATELLPLDSAVDLAADDTNDSSIVANLLDLLNRSAETQQVLLAKAFVSSCSDAVVVECSNYDQSSGSLLEPDRLSWLLRNAQRPGRTRVRLAFNQEAIALPVKTGYWLVAIGSVDMDRVDSPTPQRTLLQQRPLFRSAAKILARLLN